MFQRQSYQIEYEILEEKTKFQSSLLEQIENFPVFYHLNQKAALNQKSEKSVVTYLEKENQKETFYEHFLLYQITFKEIINIAFVILGIILISQEKLKIIDFVMIDGIGKYLWNALETLVKLNIYL